MNKVKRVIRLNNNQPIRDDYPELNEVDISKVTLAFDYLVFVIAPNKQKFKKFCRDINTKYLKYVYINIKEDLDKLKRKEYFIVHLTHMDYVLNSDIQKFLDVLKNTNAYIHIDIKENWCKTLSDENYSKKFLRDYDKKIAKKWKRVIDATDKFEEEKNNPIPQHIGRCYIMAGSREEFHQCKENLPVGVQGIYIYDMRGCLGIAEGSEIILYGNFYINPNFSEIYHYLHNNRKCNIRKIEEINNNINNRLRQLFGNNNFRVVRAVSDNTEQDEIDPNFRIESREVGAWNGVHEENRNRLVEGLVARPDEMNRNGEILTREVLESAVREMQENSNGFLRLGQPLRVERNEEHRDFNEQALRELMDHNGITPLTTDDVTRRIHGEFNSDRLNENNDDRNRDGRE